MRPFTAEDAIAIIKATRSGVRPPKTVPAPDALAEDLNRAWMRYNALAGSSETLRMSTPAFAEELKEYALKIEKSAKALASLLATKDKLLIDAWQKKLLALLMTQEIKLPITQEALFKDEGAIDGYLTELVGALSALQEASRQTRTMKGNFLSYQMTPEIVQPITAAKGIDDDRKAEFALITMLLPLIYQQHFGQEFAVTIRPKRGAGARFAKACLVRMGLHVSDSSLHDYWHRRNRQVYAAAIDDRQFFVSVTKKSTKRKA